MTKSRSSRGVELIREERVRQYATKGFCAAHDDDHVDNELAFAGACYAMLDSVDTKEFDRLWRKMWPFLVTEWSPDKSAINNLVKAGAFIAAEIDRLLRAEEEDPGDVTDNVAQPCQFTWNAVTDSGHEELLHNLGIWIRWLDSAKGRWTVEGSHVCDPSTWCQDDECETSVCINYPSSQDLADAVLLPSPDLRSLTVTLDRGAGVISFRAIPLRRKGIIKACAFPTPPKAP